MIDAAKSIENLPKPFPNGTGMPQNLTRENIMALKKMETTMRTMWGSAANDSGLVSQASNAGISNLSEN